MLQVLDLMMHSSAQYTVNHAPDMTGVACLVRIALLLSDTSREYNKLITIKPHNNGYK